MATSVNLVFEQILIFDFKAYGLPLKYVRIRLLE